MLRRTKIVATLGPATDDPKALDGIIQAGVDVVRINFSHGEPDEHRRRVEAVRNRARAHGRQVGVLADLQGPKIRIDRFKEGKVTLVEGERFVLDANWPVYEGTRERVGLTYKELPNDVDRAEAVQAIEVIIAATDAVMVARGDLGVEIGDAELPAVQKTIIRLARSMNRVVITATQMMESMIENPIPTRAEVFDVANAVLDGTD